VSVFPRKWLRADGCKSVGPQRSRSPFGREPGQPAGAERALALGGGASMLWVRHLFVLGASPSTEVLIGDDPSHHRRVGRGDWLATA
jgi:hypothetical protein